MKSETCPDTSPGGGQFGGPTSRRERADDFFLIREACTASDVLRQVVQLPLPSVNVHRRPLAVAAVVTQLVAHEATLYWAMITLMTRRLARYL